MNLYINTSGKLCEIALLNENLIIEHIVHHEPMQHSIVLHDLINQILQNNNLSFLDLQVISVLNGPGSYTGLRVGLSAAKSFSYSLNIPLVLFNKLELICSYYQHINKNCQKVACIEPARSGEYFFCLKEENSFIYTASVYDVDKIKSHLMLHDDTVLIGSDKYEIEELALSAAQVAIPLEFVGNETHKSLEINKLIDPMRAEPFYLKKVHANKPKPRF